MGNQKDRVRWLVGSVLVASLGIACPAVSFAESHTASVRVVIIIPERHISMRDRLAYGDRASSLQTDRAKAMERTLTHLASAAIDAEAHSE